MYRKIVLLGMTLLLGVPMSQAKKEPKSIPPVPLTPQQQRLVQQAIGDQLAKMLLAGEVHDGDVVPVNVSPDGDALVLG